MEKLEGNTGRVLNYLRTYKKGISSIQAFEMFGATRISAIIYNLRRYGYNIESVWKESKNRYGDKVRYVQYILRSDK
jgi:hypothetical protein